MTAAMAVQVKRFTASRDHACAAGCGTEVASGDQAGYIGGLTGAACAKCCDTADQVDGVALVAEPMLTSGGPVAQLTAVPDLDEPVEKPAPVEEPVEEITEDDPRHTLADLSLWTGEATSRGTDPQLVGDELIDLIREGILAGDMRSRQVEIGPSEIGHPCARSLAYRLAGVPHTGTQNTPWRQWIGTQVHTGTELFAHQANANRGTRWLTDLYVEVGELYPGRAIRGHLDFLDLLTATIVDLKVPGSTAMRTYGPGKPESPQYRIQVNAYGRGVQRAGFLPEHVAILRLSPARELHEGIFKAERYDEQVAVDALNRAGGIARMVDALGAQAAAALPPTDFHCNRCSWFRPGSTDLTTGCPGAPGAIRPRRDSFDALVG